MAKTTKVRIDFEEGYAKATLAFINETQAGRFTETIPGVPNVEITRLQIQEQDNVIENEQPVLFGIL